jgi:hypothetical protein
LAGRVPSRDELVEAAGDLDVGSCVARWQRSAAALDAWPMRCISSAVEAPVPAVIVLAVCRRSWKWKPSGRSATAAWAPGPIAIDGPLAQYVGALTGEHRGSGIYLEDHLWWATAGFLDLDDAIRRLER